MDFNNFLTLKEVAKLLHISDNYAKTQWAKWLKNGVNPIKFGGNGHLLFKKSEILNMVENWKIIKK